jgi:lipoprotein-anchoring transpeptidase ErfK/SrfK
MRNSISEFAKARGLSDTSGKLDRSVWAELEKFADKAPAQIYVVTQADVDGPFTAKIPTDFSAMAKLDALNYRNVVELLAERFHMDEALLRRLNPGVDFTKVGTSILVAQPGDNALPGPVATVRIYTKGEYVTAHDASGRTIASFPATVGSKDFPAPSGEWGVNTVAPNPVYYYDPKRLTFGEGEAAGKLKLAAGPNNPVGSVWIDLTKDTYGIHGAPEPKLVGKVSSHGCVRLTNWDALSLSKSVGKDTKVIFVGDTGA